MMLAYNGRVGAGFGAAFCFEPAIRGDEALVCQKLSNLNKPFYQVQVVGSFEVWRYI